MLANLVGLLIVAAILTRAGLVPPETLDAAGALADTFAERNLVSAFLSAVLAGTTMTLFIWLAHAVERDSARVLIAMLIGFILAVPSLNHAVMGRWGRWPSGSWQGRPRRRRGPTSRRTSPWRSSATWSAGSGS